MTRCPHLSVPALSLAALLACTKSEPPTVEPPADKATAAPSAASAAPPSTSTALAVEPEAGAAAEDAAATAEPASSGAKPAAAKDSGSAAPSGSAAVAEADCGKKPLPDCPLQGWMKTNANAPITNNDLPALAGVFDKIVGFAPPGYTNWASIAKDGAKAARAGDMAAAKASCRTCHDQYKQKYKTELRGRKI